MLAFNGLRTEVNFKLLTPNAVKFSPAVNGLLLTPLSFEKLWTINV